MGDFDAASCQGIGFVASDTEIACREVSLYDMGNAKEPERPRIPATDNAVSG